MGEILEKIAEFILYLRRKIWYAAFMAVLAFLSAGMLAYEFFGENVSEETIRVMADLDLGIAYIFLADFLLAFYFAKSKVQHLKEDWLDLLSSIPLSDGLFRAMRILRFVRLIRLVRVANVGLNIEDSIEMVLKRYRRRQARKRLQRSKKRHDSVQDARYTK